MVYEHFMNPATVLFSFPYRNIFIIFRFMKLAHTKVCHLIDQIILKAG